MRHRPSGVVDLEVIMQFRLTNSQRYLVNAKPGTNHSTNPKVTVSGNPNLLTLLTTNPTNPTTKYRCEFINLNCIYTDLDDLHGPQSSSQS